MSFQTEKTKKIAINCCYGGFGLSDIASEELLKRKKIPYYVVTTISKDGEVISKKFYHKTSTQRNRVKYEEDPSPENEYKDYIGMYSYYTHEERADPDLIAVIEELGDEANEDCAKLTIIEIPDDVNWEIVEYDGIEYVAEKHRTWHYTN